MSTFHSADFLSLSTPRCGDLHTTRRTTLRSILALLLDSFLACVLLRFRHCLEIWWSGPGTHCGVRAPPRPSRSLVAQSMTWFSSRFCRSLSNPSDRQYKAAQYGCYRSFLKPGRIIWQWVTREGRWRLYLAIVPNIFGPETGHTFFLHVQDTRLSKEPLVSPSAVAVIVDVFEVVLECSPVLWAIQMNMNFLVLLVEFFD